MGFAVMRWKGLVEASLAGPVEAGGVTTIAGPVTEELPEDCDSILKYGLRLSGFVSSGDVALPLDEGTGGMTAAGATSRSLLLIWLLARVGVEAWGVICCGPSSSSDESESSSMASSWRRSSSSRFLAASISARRAASLDSFSLASARAAFFFLFSSSFLILPSRTCSSSSLRRCSAVDSSSSSAFALVL
jgi:hypothetical protein